VTGILNKTNKNDYILLSRALKARTGNAEIHNIVGNLEELVTNTNGLKLRDFATYNNIKIMNPLYKQNTIRPYTWSARNSQHSYRLFHCKQEAIRTISRREILQSK
jgi:hypothetical protein